MSLLLCASVVTLLPASLVTSQPVNLLSDIPALDLTKITFDVSRLSPEGLMGQGNGRRSLSYEFCIPATDAAMTELKAIDPAIQMYPDSRGRIGCQSHQVLCIGNTHTPRWREILAAIAHLPYVERIDEFLGE